MSNINHLKADEIMLLRSSIKSELEPFLDRIRMTPQDRLLDFKASYLKFITRYEQSSKIVEFIMFGQIAEVDDNAPISDQLFDLFFYLGLVESFGNCYVDLLVMLLIANGRDFHIETMHSTPRIKHVNSMNDLEKEKVPLTTKLNFLKDNGIKTFSSIIDSKLRNIIAHLNFEIIENRIIIKGKPTKDIIAPCFERVIIATTEVSNSLYKLAVDLGWEKPRNGPVGKLIDDTLQAIKQSLEDSKVK